MASKRALGIDIGGTRLRVAVIEETGQVLARQEVFTQAQAGPDAVIGQIVEIADRIAPDRGGIIGAGISCPGPLDTTRGLAMGIPTLAGWDNIPIADMIGSALGLPVRLENDGIAAAMGEWTFGAGKGLNNIVYVTISTGIGGGVVIDGRVAHGRMGMAAHIGHMIVERDGEACSCGNHGCWEAYASGTAFGRRIARRALVDLPDPKAVFAAASAGDARALELVAEQADWLGVGIANLLHLYSPDAVLLGGGVANGFALLWPGITARLAVSAMPAFKAVPVKPAGLGENAGLIGAAAMCF